MELIKTNVSTVPYFNATQFDITQFGEYTANITSSDQTGNTSISSIKFYGIEIINGSTEIPAGNKTPVIVHKDIVIEAAADETANASIALTVILAPSNRSINASSVAIKDAKATRYIEIDALTAGNISNVTLRVNYTSREVNGLDENTLCLYYWDKKNNTWYSLKDYSGKDMPDGTHINGAGVDTSSKQVWANLNHFSTFAFGGVPPSSGGSPSSGSSSSSSSSSGGGGGGGTSGEDYNNIERTEKYEKSIYKDISTSYQFTQNGLVEFVNITGNVNADSVNTIVEVLRNASSFANIRAPGLVYRYVNIWVGTTGFASPHNIKEATITFRVNNTWLDENGIGRVVMYRYSDGKWVELQTAEQQKNNAYVLYRATTDRFSPFAIVGVASGGKTAQYAQQASIQYPVATARPVSTKTANSPSNSGEWSPVLTVALVGIVAGALLFMKKNMM